MNNIPTDKLSVSGKMMSKLQLLLFSLFVGFLLIIYESSKETEYAKIVNTAGEIRGGVQRVVKLYFAGDINKATSLIPEIDKLFTILNRSVDSLKFPLLDDEKTLKPIAVKRCWEEIKEEILQLKNEKKLLKLSEICWHEANRQTALYQRLATRNIKLLNYLIISLFSAAFLLLFWLFRLVKNEIAANLEARANYDPLTGILNRSTFVKLYNLLSRDKLAHPLGFVIFDIDNFKEINDRYGHQVGDKVLKVVTEIVKRQLRKSDIFARWGGEEFTLLLPHTDLEGSKKVAEKIRRVLESLHIPELKGRKITASFGVTEAKREEPLEEVFTRADKALYRAKQGGKNRVEVNPP